MVNQRSESDAERPRVSAGQRTRRLFLFFLSTLNCRLLALSLEGATSSP